MDKGDLLLLFPCFFGALWRNEKKRYIIPEERKYKAGSEESEK